MKKSAKLFLMLIYVFVLLLVVACGGNNEGSKPTDTDAKEVQGKELNVIRSAMMETLDPVASSSVANADGFVQLYEPLLRKSGSGEFFPVLAETWEISPDGLTYTVKLRQGVKFSDGSDLTADDVVFSINRTKESNYTKVYLTSVKSVEAKDASTVAVTLNAPTTAFLDSLSTVYIVNKANVEKSTDKFGKTIESVVTTAPYLCKEFTPAVSIAFEKNPNYWGEPASIEKFNIRLVADTNTASIALQTGDADLYLNDMPATYLKDFKAMDNRTVTEFPGTTCFFVALNCEKGEFTDPNFRKAIAYAIDREKNLTVTLENLGELCNTLGNSNFTSVPKDLDWYEYNVEKAKEYLEKCGKEGTNITIKVPAITSYVSIATCVQNDLQAIGLKVNVEQQENATFVDNVVGNYLYTMAVASIGTKTTDFFEAADKLFSTNPINYYRYNNKEYDALVTRGNSELDPTKRIEYYTQAEKLAIEDVAVIPLFYNLGIRAYRSDIKCDPNLISYDCVYYYHWKE